MKRLLLGNLINIFVASAFTCHGSVALAVQIKTEDKVAANASFVQRLQAATVRISSSGQFSSGVFVSADADILTVAHGISTNAKHVVVTASNGRRFRASIVKYDSQQDLALLRTEDPATAAKLFEELTFLNFAQRSPDIGESVLASGYPARELAQSAAIRLGEITAADSRYVKSTCRLTVGDSGGPIVNLQGQLVGLNARIADHPRTNLHLSLPLMNAFTSKYAFKHPLASNESSFEIPKFQDAQRAAWILATAGQKDVFYATLVQPDLLVAKLSLLPDQPIVCQTTNQPVQVIHRARSLDLAYLQLPSKHSVQTFGETSVGSVIQTEKSTGIVTRVQHDEPDVSPVLGCSLIVDAGQLRVSAVASNSAATEAGLKKDDRLIGLGGRRVKNFQDVADALAGYQPGDRILFVTMRSGVQSQAFGQLRHNAANMLQRSEFLDGKTGQRSQRRTGFQGVIQHDADLAPNQMGSAVFDAQGRLVAVNVAVRSRESILAVPIKRVLQQIAQKSP